MNEDFYNCPICKLPTISAVFCPECRDDFKQKKTTKGEVMDYEELESRCQMLEAENQKLKFGFADEIKKWIDRKNPDDECDPHSVKFLKTSVSKRGRYCAVLEDNEGCGTYGYGNSLLDALIDVFKRVKP